jgi:DNA-binding MarR family transcriptional regulator
VPPGAAPDRLAHLPSWLLSAAARRGDRLVTAALGRDGLGKHHFRALVALDDHGPSSQADIGRSIMLDRSDLHAVLNRLEADGLVARAPDPDDRRRNVAALTDAGRRTLRRLEQRVIAAQDDLLASLDGAERDQLGALLERVAAG